MIFVKKMFAVLCISLCLLPIGNTQTFNPALAARLQTTLDSLVTLFATNTKGISASVYCPGQGFWKGASGISYAGQPITTDMRFGIASNTKLFVAATLLKLVENNIITLDDPLSAWLPAFSNVNPNITIRQLLNHTSGLSDPFFTTGLLDTIEKHPTHLYTPQEILSWLGPPAFSPPGSGYTYSNVNYILAGMVAKNATGIAISQLMRDSILNPLQLDSTFYDILEAPNGIIAHRWRNGVDYNDTSRVGINSAGGPAGSLFSTAGEMAQWYHAILGNSVLQPSSFAELTTFASPGNYGLGLQKWIFFGRTTWGHAGATFGYKSRMIYDPCMQTVVGCLSNSDLSAVDGITALLYKVLVDVLPTCPGTLTGPTVVCQGQNSVTYTVPSIANASTYAWTLPAGASGTSSSNSIVVNFGLNAVSGTITVRGQNNYGPGAAATLAVVVQSKPPTPTITLNGNILQSDAPAGNQWYDANGVIAGATGQFYTITATGSYFSIVTLLGCSSNNSNKIDVVYSPFEIELAAFYGERQMDGNHLYWTTASETNHASFEVQRSDGGLDFATIGAIAGAGNSLEKKEYQFTDKNARNRTVFYRLKQIDNSGQFDYSGIIALPITEAIPHIYPNPVRDILQIVGCAEEEMTYEIATVAGAITTSGKLPVDGRLDVSALPSGVYVFKIPGFCMPFVK